MKIIDELAKKADIVQSSGDVEKARRFAELIVQQAIAVIQRRDMGDNNREDMEVRRCVEDLKQYFEMDASKNRGWTYPHERETTANETFHWKKCFSCENKVFEENYICDPCIHKLCELEWAEVVRTAKSKNCKE